MIQVGTVFALHWSFGCIVYRARALCQGQIRKIPTGLRVCNFIVRIYYKKLHTLWIALYFPKWCHWVIHVPEGKMYLLNPAKRAKISGVRKWWFSMQVVLWLLNVIFTQHCCSCLGNFGTKQTTEIYPVHALSTYYRLIVSTYITSIQYLYV